jgi:acyl carrier protein
MSRADVFQKVMEIIKPFVKNEEVFQQANESTNLLHDLKVNSARLIDIILNLQDEFDLEIEDEDANSVDTVGDAVSLIMEKLQG